MENKDINRFVIMCIEQYAKYKNISSKDAYLIMSKNNIINKLIDNYEDLHGMSTEYLNDYISSLVKNHCSYKETKLSQHTLATTIIITKVIELIVESQNISLDKARDALYHSEIIDLLDDDETGLYGESPLYVFSLFLKYTQHI